MKGSTRVKQGAWVSMRMGCVNLFWAAKLKQEYGFIWALPNALAAVYCFRGAIRGHQAAQEIRHYEEQIARLEKMKADMEKAFQDETRHR